MHFILNPLLLNIIVLLFPLGLLTIIKHLLGVLIYKTFDIYEYKIHNKVLSIILVITYISTVIILFYILRLYHLPREVDLKLLLFYYITVKEQITNLFGSLKIPIFWFSAFILTAILCCLLVIKGHKIVYKEIYKWFLFLKAKKVFPNNIRNFFVDIALHKDVLYLVLNKISFYFTKKKYGYKKQYGSSTIITFNSSDLPWYNSTKIINILMGNKYYAKLMRVSLLFMIVYLIILF